MTLLDEIKQEIDCKQYTENGKNIYKTIGTLEQYLHKCLVNNIKVTMQNDFSFVGAGNGFCLNYSPHIITYIQKQPDFTLRISGTFKELNATLETLKAIYGKHAKIIDIYRNKP